MYCVSKYFSAEGPPGDERREETLHEPQNEER